MKNHSLARTWLATCMLVAISSAAVAAEQPVHVRGTITRVSASGFTVQTDSGMQNVVVSATTRIAGVVPSSVDAIQPGSFIGSANLSNGKTGRAQEVVVFPPAMKGSGMGDHPWDLPAQGGGMSAMTNGSVMSSAMTDGTVKDSSKSDDSMMQSAMTNGTVKTASGNGSRTIVVDYGKGEKTLDIPAGTPIVTFKPADRKAIIKGAHVFVIGQAGSPVAAAMVAVGLDGTVPPM
ncbi:metal ABC transporter permease [Rhodanobacter sp. L36]|uniref:metal ABC transporter permease n=1 Tax=Rhodanobacter sp. L36 TaxID=1747221 RepID=UPI00131AFE8F|nr:metal ABC transporter permease [Rhodanobacter sp. L36]